MAAYTQQQRDEFLELAQQVGPGKARAELGYPSENTATRWWDAAGLERSVDPLRSYARQVQAHYGATEQLALIDANMRAIYARLTTELYVTLPGSDVPHLQPLTGNELNQLASATSKLVVAARLIRGETTENLGVGAVEHLTERNRALYDRAIETTEATLHELGAAS